MRRRSDFLVFIGSLLAAAGCCGVSVDGPGPDDARYKIINGPDDVSSSSVLVELDSVPDAAFLDGLAAFGVTSVEPLFNMEAGDTALKKALGMDRCYEAFLEEGADLETVAAGLASYGAVRTVQYNKQYHKASDCMVYPYPGPAVPAAKASGFPFNDPLLGEQWSYRNTGNKAIAVDACAGADLNVTDVWENLTAGDNSIVVAVVDEGVKYTHPDLAANMWTGADGSHGYNFVDNGPVTWDKPGDTGHGTHCAGSIAAVNNNGIGVAGVAGGTGKGDGVRIMSCQIFSGGRGGTDAVIARAIEYAADNGASIISCSFGYSDGVITSDGAYARAAAAEYRAIRYFQGVKNNDVLDGGIAVFAAGNEGRGYSSYPGGLCDVISVSAFAPDFLPAYYTNFGPGCNVAAPGGEYNHRHTRDFGYLVFSAVLSTIPSEVKNEQTNPAEMGEYAYMQGTSMACPHVSGVAALGLAYAKKLGRKFTAAGFRDMLVTSAEDLDTRLTGEKEIYNMEPFPLSKYYRKLGTGALDAWRFMMKIEGVPSILVIPGEEASVSLADYFGTASKNLAYLGVEVLGSGKESLGLVSEPYMQNGRLHIRPSKTGSARIRISAVAGGDTLGGDAAVGGMEVSQTVSVISRNIGSANGGWL